MLGGVDGHKLEKATPKQKPLDLVRSQRLRPASRHFVQDLKLPVAQFLPLGFYFFGHDGQRRKLTLYANELSSDRVVLFIEPIGIDQSRIVVVRIGNDFL